jgi:hypothetical protein
MPHQHLSKNSLTSVSKQDAEQVVLQFTNAFLSEIDRLEIVATEKEKLKHVARALFPSVMSLWGKEENLLSDGLKRKFRNPQAISFLTRSETLMVTMFDHYHLQFLKHLEEKGLDVPKLHRVGHFVKNIPRILMTILRSDGWDEIASSIAITDAATGFRVKSVLFGLLTLPLLMGTNHAFGEFQESLVTLKKENVGQNSRASRVGSAVQQGLEVMGYAGMAVGTFMYMLNQITALSESVVSGGHTNSTSSGQVNGFIFADQPVSVQLQVVALVGMMLGQVPMAIRAAGSGATNVYQAVSYYLRRNHHQPNQTEQQISYAEGNRKNRDARNNLLEFIFHHIPVGVGQSLLFWANIETMQKIMSQDDSDTTALQSARAYIGLGLTLGGLFLATLPKLLPKKGSSAGGGLAKQTLPRPQLQHQESLRVQSREYLTQKHREVSVFCEELSTFLASKPTLDRDEELTLFAIKQVIEVIRDEEIPSAFGWVKKQPQEDDIVSTRF